jgi:hypothetical protein
LYSPQTNETLENRKTLDKSEIKTGEAEEELRRALINYWLV